MKLFGILVVGLALATSSHVWAAPPSPRMEAQDFVTQAGQSDQYEIQTGRLIVAQGENERVRAFAAEMIDAHTKTSEAMGAAAAASGLMPPSKTMGGDQQGMLSALQSMKGADLDRAYATQQVMAHTSALTTQESYAAAGADPNLRKTAQATVPLIQHHLEMARQIKASLGQ